MKRALFNDRSRHFRIWNGPVVPSELSLAVPPTALLATNDKVIESLIQHL
jgi:hypothetical protein